MSLTLLVIIVVAGIGLVVMTVHISGGSKSASLDDEDAARARFAQDFPERAVSAVHVTQDRGAAFLALEDGRVGIVQRMGSRFLTRIVSAGGVNGAPRASDASVAIRFRDFTWPGGVFAFANSDEADAVVAMFAGLRRDRAGERA